MSETQSCCRCCSNFILALGLSALSIWLSLRTSNPKCSIEFFYLPALNSSLLHNLQKNSTIYFHLQLVNTNNDKGVYYDPINLTFSFPLPNETSYRFPLGKTTLKGFYQGHKKKAKKNGSADAPGLNWSQVALQNEILLFRVDLLTAVRFKILFWKSKRHVLKLGGTVEVNATLGTKVKKKGIKLGSGAQKHHLFLWLVIFSAFFSALVVDL